MPGPKNKSRNKGNGIAKSANAPNESSRQLNAENSNQCFAEHGETKHRAQAPGAKRKGRPAKATQCLTLEEDEMTRCNQPVADDCSRCSVHQAQYSLLYKNYKEASKAVDKIKDGREIPTKEQIGRCTDLETTLAKARWVRKYIESMRMERTGRDIHQRRFFLKADDGHKIRIKVIAKEMVKAVEILDILHARALHLYVASNPDCDWVQPQKNSDEEGVSSETIVEAAQLKGHLPNDGLKTFMRILPAPGCSALMDEDLIDLEHRAQKARLLNCFKLITEPEFIKDFYRDVVGLDSDMTESANFKELASVTRDMLQQYARRIIFYEPDLFFKSIDKVSFKDLFLDDDFSHEDLTKLAIYFMDRLGFRLMWFKDATLEAIAMSKGGIAANVGNLSSRSKIVGGWIYNCPHTYTIPNEAWWYMLQILQPPADVENRFIRLCNNFDDMINFLSFGAIGMIPPPTFCSKQHNGVDAVVSRNHLSLCGVAITDMVSISRPSGPLPTQRRGRKPGCVVWCEIETRGYIFGALRNEPDPFNDAFLRELRARPDLFQVVIRSETDPGHDVHVFGTGPAGVLPCMRLREFEAPLASYANRPTSSGDWTVVRSAVDILYGTDAKVPGMPKQPLHGYLYTLESGKNSGWFFRFKKFPVQYIVILDTVPNRHHSILARNVAWAAIRARGYGDGEYEPRKYARASDKLFQKRAEELLAWMPGSWGGWQATKMGDESDEADEAESTSKAENTGKAEGTGEEDETGGGCIVG